MRRPRSAPRGRNWAGRRPQRGVSVVGDALEVGPRSGLVQRPLRRCNAAVRFAIQFLPWCELANPVSVGDVRFLPWDRDAPRDDMRREVHDILRRVLLPYREANVGKDGQLPSVQRCVVIEFRGEVALVEPDDDTLRQCQDAARMLALAGLSHRSLGGALGSYCNAANFTYFGHWLKDDLIHFSTTIRRAGGHALVGGHRFDESIVTRPEHAARGPAPIDLLLLDALARARTQLLPRKSSELWDALLMFNNANTDDTWFPQELELIAMVGALQRLLDTRSDRDDFARAFESSLVPTVPVAVDTCPRASASFGGKSPSSVRYAWAREIYRLRGDPAHGVIASRQPRAWDDFHHLVLLRFSFPLIVKSELSKAGIYTLTGDDQDRIDAFELWACDSKPFEQPEGATWGPQSRLDHAIAAARDKRVWAAALAKFEQRLRDAGDPSP